MLNRIRAYPMIVLLLPLIAAILICDRFYPLRQPYHKTPPNALQTQLYSRLEAAGLSGDELATVGALTLGYKEALTPELRHLFAASGAAHVLAVSGLHTGIIYGLLWWLLTLSGRFKPMHEDRLRRWALSLIIIGCMWGYAWLTGMTPSVVRAVLMVTIFEVGRMLYKRAFSLNTVAAAAVLILLAHPSDLWSISFQLSFAATASILIVTRGTERHWGLHQLKNSFFGRILAGILGIIIISLAAQLGTLGITVYCFKQMSVYFLLTNLIVLPLATLLVPCGLVTVALGGSTVGLLIGKVTHSLAWILNHAVEWIEHLPGSTVSAQVNGYLVALYYIILVLFFIFATKK